MTPLGPNLHGDLAGSIGPIGCVVVVVVVVVVGLWFRDHVDVNDLA